MCYDKNQGKGVYSPRNTDHESRRRDFMESIEFLQNLETPTQSEGSLKEVAELAASIQAQEIKILELEAQIKEEKNLYKKLSEIELPELMETLGLSEFSLVDGSKVTIKESVQASITKANEQAAFQWLRDNGFGDLIKNEIKTVFGKGQEELAEEAANKLQEIGVEVNRKKSVHPSTLKAFVKEELSQGRDVPSDLFSIFIGKKSLIKEKK